MEEISPMEIESKCPSFRKLMENSEFHQMICNEVYSYEQLHIHEVYSAIFQALARLKVLVTDEMRTDLTSVEKKYKAIFECIMGLVNNERCTLINITKIIYPYMLSSGYILSHQSRSENEMHYSFKKWMNNSLYWIKILFSRIYISK